MKQVTETKRADPIASLHAGTNERIEAIRKNTKKCRVEIEKYIKENMALRREKDNLVQNVKAKNQIRMMMLKKKGIDVDKGGAREDTNV